MILFLLIEDALDDIICPGLWLPGICEHLSLGTEQALDKILPIISQVAKQMHWYRPLFSNRYIINLGGISGIIIGKSFVC